MDRINLNNGLTCYIHKHDNEINFNGAMAALIIRAGSNNEKEDEQGIYHFLEHMNVHLMPWLPSIKEETLEPIRYAYTNFNETVYVFMNLFKKYENHFITGCINTMKHILNRDFLSETLLPYVREDVLKEYEATDFNKAVAISRLFQSESYNITLPIGNITCIKRFNYNDLITHHNKLYLPENAAVVIIGGVNAQQTADIIKNAFSARCESGYLIKRLIKTVVMEQNFANTEIESYSYNEDNSRIYFLSKTKREWICLNKHIEDALCIHLAIDEIKLAAYNFLNEKGITASEINGSVEIFSYDWYIIRLDIAFRTDTGFKDRHLEQCIKRLKPELSIFNQVKIDFMRQIETSPHYDTYQLLGEYIEHYLYNEPIFDLNDEINHIYQAINKIDYDMVSERYREIISNLIVI